MGKEEVRDTTSKAVKRTVIIVQDLKQPVSLKYSSCRMLQMMLYGLVQVPVMEFNQDNN
ncbi:hypothetical protein ACSQ67_023909 [Phaseolus vulgaris]